MLKAGTTYTGQLKPIGGGADGNPIIIDMYGTGYRPRIDGEGQVSSAILLENISYIEVSNLDYEENTLPNGIYSVVLLVDRIPRNTIWVSYRAADRLSSYIDITTRREVVNAVSLFDKGTGRLSCRVTASASGSYDVDVEI